MLLLLGAFANICVYVLGLILVFSDSKTKKTGAVYGQPYVTPTYYGQTQPKQPNIVPPKPIPAYQVMTEKQVARIDAKEWMKKYSDFLIYQTGKAIDDNNQRNFVITADKLKDLSDVEKKQLVQLLMEIFDQQINEAVLDKNGNINCYYYQG